MKCWAFGVALIATVLAGCHKAHSVSGDYLAIGERTVIQLQLVEDASMHVTGVLATYRIDRNNMQSGKGVKREETNVSGGSVDGDNLILILGRNSLFTTQQNVVGRITSNGEIRLLGAYGEDVFTPVKEARVTAAVSDLQAKASAEWQANVVQETRRTEQRRQAEKAAALKQKIARDTAFVHALSDELNTYNGSATKAGMGTEIRAEAERIVANAQKDLADMQQSLAVARYNQGSADWRVRNAGVQANGAAIRARGRIIRAHGDMEQLGFRLHDATHEITENLKNIDSRVARNPCTANPGLQGCHPLSVEIKTYAVVRAKTYSETKEMTAAFNKQRLALAAIYNTAMNAHD